MDTGETTLTGGRLKESQITLIRFATYGDGVADIDITALIEHHKKMGKEATLTAVKPHIDMGH